MVVVELVEYKLNPGADENNFLEMQRAVKEYFLDNQIGFLGPIEICKQENGTWIEIIRWRSLIDAKKAQRDALDDETCNLYFSYIDPSSVDMRYFEERGVLS